MLQYKRIKNENRDSVLFFRLGDFYEMFEDDAREVSRILNLTLTRRHNIPMCGIPYHAADNYIGRLLKAGKKIAICEQVSLPEKGKGIADRKVVEIITPGTVIQDNYLEKDHDNYLIAIGKNRDFLSLTGIDLSSGDFFCTALGTEETAEELKKELNRLHPRELIIQESLLEEDPLISRIISENSGIMVNRFPDWMFDQQTSYRMLTGQFRTGNLKAFGLTEESPAIFTAGALLEYVADTSKVLLRHVAGIRYYRRDDYVGIDESTQKNLELVKNQFDGSSRYTLFEVLDYTRTAAGARQLKRWVLHPLKDIVIIKKRQDRVEHLYHNQLLLSELREILRQVLDLQRLTAKVAMEKAHGKDLLSVKNTLGSCLEITALLESHAILLPEWTRKSGIPEAVQTVFALIEKSIKEDASVVLTEGGIIRSGYNDELDRLRQLKHNSRKILEQYVEDEKKQTGIPNLRIKFNKIIGYYLEVTKSNSKLVPEHFIRRQQLVNGDRFTTERLGELESDINNASEKIIEIEKTLFLEIRQQVQKHIDNLQAVSGYLTDLDCFQSLAQAATVHGYVKPQLHAKQELSVRAGRHPVVECHIAAGNFVPNSIDLSGNGKSFALITGPNMAGKSTYLRQTALIVLMAQIGSFVPADEAHIGMVDQIFCRVGASDNLARGESTFLVEMNETAYILRNAGTSSLVIMDEVGRGTGTNDGLSIAWAVCEELLERKIKTLFATHYHELTQLQHKNIENLSMDTKENRDEIIFLKRVKKGSAANSYGIHVARLAGLPDKVVEKAKLILSRLVKFEKQIDIRTGSRQEEKQEELFPVNEIVLGDIMNCRVDTMTPLEALNKIKNWQDELLK